MGGGAWRIYLKLRLQPLSSEKCCRFYILDLRLPGEHWTIRYRQMLKFIKTCLDSLITLKNLIQVFTTENTEVFIFLKYHPPPKFFPWCWKLKFCSLAHFVYLFVFILYIYIYKNSSEVRFICLSYYY